MSIHQKVAGAIAAQEAASGGGVNFLKRVWRCLFKRKKTDGDDPSECRGEPRIGLALSSGGAKSLAHIGVIQVLEEHQIPVHAISGSSMGSYIGALWAAGCNGEQLEELAASMQDRKILRKLADPAPPFLQGFLKGEKAKAHLGQTLGHISFRELKKKLIVIAADLDTYERVVLREGSVLDAVHASCAMPGIIVPVTVNGRRCTDGGVVEPVPVSSMRKFCDVDLVFAVSTLPGFEQLDRKRSDDEHVIQEEMELGLWGKIAKGIGSLSLTSEGNTIDTLRRSIRIAQIRIAHDAIKDADVVMHAHSHQESRWHDYDNFKHFIEIGRTTAEEQLPTIKEVIKKYQTGDYKHERKIQKLVG